MEGMASTGEMGGRVREHSLLINVRKKGLVVLTGCSHPGVINIVKRAKQVSGIVKIFAVIGDLHISSTYEGINTARYVHRMGVE